MFGLLLCSFHWRYPLLMYFFIICSIYITQVCDRLIFIITNLDYLRDYKNITIRNIGAADQCGPRDGRRAGEWRWAVDKSMGSSHHSGSWWPLHLTARALQPSSHTAAPPVCLRHLTCFKFRSQEVTIPCSWHNQNFFLYLQYMFLTWKLVWPQNLRTC